MGKSRQRLGLGGVVMVTLLLSDVTFGAGDFNGDGSYDCLDIDMLTSDVAGNTNSPQFDLTGDGFTDRHDITAWLAEAGDANLGPGESYLYTDGNLDGVVDVSDWDGLWGANKFTFGSDWCRGDWFVDGSFDVLDHLLWSSNMFLASSTVDGPGYEGTLQTGTSQAIYDPGTGDFFLKTNGHAISGLTVEGPQPLTSFDLAGGFVSHPDGMGGSHDMFWNSAFFNGKQQLYGIYLGAPQGMQGAFRLAQYEAGLTPADFGVVIYGGPRSDPLTSTEPGSMYVNDVTFATVLPADANLDGFVDVSDFNLWNAGKFGPDFTAFWDTGDFNGDGQVDVSDFNVWNGNKFTSVGQSVPEPVTMSWLVCLGVLIGCRRACGPCHPRAHQC